MAELVSKDGKTWLVRLPKGYYFLGLTVFPLLAAGALWLIGILFVEEGISGLFAMLALYLSLPVLLAYRFIMHIPYLKYDLEVSEDKVVVIKSEQELSSYSWEELNIVRRISLSSMEVYKGKSLLAVVSSGCHSYKQFFELANSAKSGNIPRKL